MSDLDQKLFEEALQRIARTPDGRMFYLHLQKILLGIPTDPEGGALRENLGRRKLASEIRAVMSKAVREQDPKVDERPFVFNFPEPVSVAGPRRRGAGPRVRDPRSRPDAGPVNASGE